MAIAGFGVRVELLGARGADEWGAMFVSSMKRAQVDTSRMQVRCNCSIFKQLHWSITPKNDCNISKNDQIEKTNYI